MKSFCAAVDDSDDGTNEDSRLIEVKQSVKHIATHFRLPLEAKGVSLVTLQEGIEEVVEYACSYLNNSCTEYRKVWYKFYFCPDASKWLNVLSLSELAFSLTFCNGGVKQIFSSLKVLNTIHRTNLQSNTE